jgi:hypothetical protein
MADGRSKAVSSEYRTSGKSRAPDGQENPVAAPSISSAPRHIDVQFAQSAAAAVQGQGVVS